MKSASGTTGDPPETCFDLLSQLHVGFLALDGNLSEPTRLTVIEMNWKAREARRGERERLGDG